MNKIEKECRKIKVKQQAWLNSEACADLLVYAAKRDYSDEMIAFAISAVFEEDIHKIITRKRT